jgi:hypothetical protein
MNELKGWPFEPLGEDSDICGGGDGIPPSPMPG